MVRTLGFRLLGATVTLGLVSVLIFAATVLLPGDAAVAVLGKTATAESLAAFRAEHHLDAPAVLQYLTWLKGLLTGDFGTSVVSGESVASLLTTRGARTFILLFLAVLIGFPIGTALGAYMAVRRNSKTDHSLSVGMLIVTGLPEFAIAVLAVLLLSTSVLHVFPAVSLLDMQVPIWTQADVLVLPVLTLVLAIVPYIALTTRSSMLEVLDSDFVAMARLKGVEERRVIWRHALPNAAGPLVQVLAVSLVYLAGGAVIVETVFQFPGLGSALVESVRNRDMVMVQSTTLLLAIVYVSVNVLADVMVMLLTPRLRTKMVAA